MTKPALIIALALAAVASLAAGASTYDRFPQPKFETGYEYPVGQYPLPRPGGLQWLDVAVLTGALGAASWLALRARSRPGLFLLGIFSLAYFGFWRKGCLCPVGSMQNVLLAAFRPSEYAAPWPAVLIFALPLFSTLLFGRTFCAAVCPLGAIQDVAIVRPVRVPPWLNRALGLIPYVYLALAALVAAAGAGFLVCRYDPFVGFFRRAGPAWILATGGGLLALGIFVARPYCRYLCPYGVLLGWMSRLSWRHPRITPDECIQCRLCETSCPFGAIRPPSPAPAEPRPARRRRALGLAARIPALLAAGAAAGWLAGEPLARLDERVATTDRLRREDAGLETVAGVRSQTVRASDRSFADLLAESDAVVRFFRRGGAAAGGFLGLVVGLHLVGTALPGRRRDWEPARALCLSCGRCYTYCPREHVRRRRLEGFEVEP